MSDAALADVARDLVPPDVALTGLEVEHVSSRVITTAREACQGAYRISPAPRCTQVDGGWLLVGVVAPEPVLDRARAWALVTSPRWFTTR